MPALFCGGAHLIAAAVIASLWLYAIE